MTVVWVVAAATLMVGALVIWAGHRTVGEVLRSPDDGDHPNWRLDLQRNQVRIPRPRS